MDIYEVGGAVRDRLMGYEPDDIDYVVVGATKDEMLDLEFQQVHVGNNEQPVFLDTMDVLGDFGIETPDTKEAPEVALARKEVSTGPGYNDFEYTTDGVELQDDLVRRDLTINAMARDPETGEVIDPFGGRNDLEDGLARHTSEKFTEDPVRVLRLARFVARYGLQVAPETREIAREVAPRLEDEPVERIRDEMLKMLKQVDPDKGGTPRRFFDVLRDVDALEVAFPLVNGAIGVETNGEYHQEGDLYTHTMLVLEQAFMLNPHDEELLLAALTHDLGKVKAHEDSYPDSRTHNEHDRFVIRNLLMGDYAPEDVWAAEQEQVMTDAVTQHMRSHTFANEPEGEMGDGKKIRLVESFNPQNHNGLSFHQLLDLMEADTYGRIPQGTFDRDDFEEEYRRIKDAMNEVSGEDVIRRHGWLDEDGNLTVDGSVVGDTIHQERLNYLRNGGKDKIEPLFKKVRYEDTTWLVSDFEDDQVQIVSGKETKMVPVDDVEFIEEEVKWV